MHLRSLLEVESFFERADRQEQRHGDASVLPRQLRAVTL